MLPASEGPRAGRDGFRQDCAQRHNGVQPRLDLVVERVLVEYARIAGTDIRQILTREPDGSR
jgi:hypothetical protein